MPGRIPSDKIEKYYSLLDISIFPRKSLKVCELVSPIKIFEALSMEKAVIVSSVAPLKEIIEHNKNGLIFGKDNIQDLANQISALIENQKLRIELGKNGREYVKNYKTWSHTISNTIHYIQNI
jgi:glycosyltransferase involved in cell wall biosynthesis